MPKIELKGRWHAYSVRTSKRAKRISVRCSLRGGLEVVYPPGMRQPEPEALLLERSDWVLSVMNKLDDARRKLPRRDYREGETFMFRGAPYKLMLIRDRSRKRIAAKLSDDHLAIHLPASVACDEAERIRSAVESFYRAQAKRYLPARLSQLAERHGFSYNQLRVKNQKTRWGSCSAKRNINLNLRLMMAPDEAIDYVIIHELCHLRELNHTPEYWALVASICPQYQHWRDWFKQHGPSLIL